MSLRLVVDNTEAEPSTGHAIMARQAADTAAADKITADLDAYLQREIALLEARLNRMFARRFPQENIRCVWDRGGCLASGWKLKFRLREVNELWVAKKVGRGWAWVWERYGEPEKPKPSFTVRELLEWLRDPQTKKFLSADVLFVDEHFEPIA